LNRHFGELVGLNFLPLADWRVVETILAGAAAARADSCLSGAPPGSDRARQFFCRAISLRALSDWTVITAPGKGRVFGWPNRSTGEIGPEIA